MHPILADRKRLALYLVTWCLFALLLALVAMEPGRAELRDALLLTLPPTIVYAFICLAAWYPTRALPLERARATSLIPAHLAAAIALSALWFAMFLFLARVLGEETEDAVMSRAAVFLVTGVLLYLIAVAFHYVLVAMEKSRVVEQREMTVKLLAREAELKALKSQLDPHFLFNSLNSISALCGSNPSSARTLTTLLAEYLRKSLRIGSADAITLSEELELASSYLAIERIRFGPRLEFEQNIDESVRSYRVPPLLLQPLVENAVTHGVGHLLDGGVVRIHAARDGERVHITVENRCDPDRPSSRGEGIGLANTRRRIAAFYGEGARIKVAEEENRFRVDLSLP
ncbi:MAG TPA: histidine kinase [Thermoanaerobaculia bacterium]|nr:histidine kinase [Thermoanaerobaculia bacterium]